MGLMVLKRAFLFAKRCAFYFVIFLGETMHLTCMCRTHSTDDDSGPKVFLCIFRNADEQKSVRYSLRIVGLLLFIIIIFHQLHVLGNGASVSGCIRHHCGCCFDVDVVFIIWCISRTSSRHRFNLVAVGSEWLAILYSSILTKPSYIMKTKRNKEETCIKIKSHTKKKKTPTVNCSSCWTNKTKKIMRENGRTKKNAKVFHSTYFENVIYENWSTCANKTQTTIDHIKYCW